MNREQLKTMAKQQIKGNIGILFLIMLIISLISGVAGAVLSLVPGGSVIASVIITPAFSLSLVTVYLNLAKGKKPEVADTFEGFKDFWSAFKVTFLVGLYTFLWTLLFIIPGIIKAYSYSMSLYILAENKGKPAKECIKESMLMMDGHKMEFFVLELSFILWHLLGIITLGIAYIWIVPYISATTINFYNSIRPIVVEATAEPVAEVPVVEAPAEEEVAQEVPAEPVSEEEAPQE